jgi:mono/diheme cytochrome c family protein
MTSQKPKPNLIAPLGGVVVGIAVFLGVNITTGRAVIPTAASVANRSDGLSPVVRPAWESASNAPGATDTYHTVCITCHQAEGQGLAGAFPPLAGSEWVQGNPELMIHIALLGLTGPIEVKGAKFNATMPPPPGLTDEKIAEAITYARSHFGNTASKVEAAHVAKVRASLAGRTNPLTTDELRSLKNTLPAEGGAAADQAPAPAPAAAEPEAPKAPPAKPKGPGKAAGKAAPKAPATPAAPAAGAAQ